MKMNENKVVIGLSGGVDSATAALILLKKGYDVHGLYLIVKPDDKEHIKAKELADKLGININIIDVTKEFEDKVINYFIDRYNKGMTPSPCLVCNRDVKFKHLIMEANKIGAKYIATGHYAKISEKDGKKYIGISNNRAKDQSYMLAYLSNDVIERIILPLEEFESKEAVRNKSKTIDKEISAKKDSQELCFVKPEMTHVDYLIKKGVNIKPGIFVDNNGNILGNSKGYQCYTVGQRKGLNIALGERVFVNKIDPKENKVTLGKNEELFAKRAITIHNKVIVNQGDFDIKVRFSNNTTKGHIINFDKEKDIMEIEFNEPVRAVTPGQFLVIYKDDLLMGVGEISDDTNKEL